MAANEKGKNETQNRQVNINMMEVSEEFLFKAQSIQELLGLQLKSSQEKCIQLQQQLQERQATIVNMESQIHLLETRVSGLQHENASQRKNYHRLDQKFRYHMKLKDDEIESLKAVIANRTVRTRTSSTSAVTPHVQENNTELAIASICRPKAHDSSRPKEGITTAPALLVTEKPVNSKTDKCSQPSCKAAPAKSVAVLEKQEHSKNSQPQEHSLPVLNKGGISLLSNSTDIQQTQLTYDVSEDQAVKSQASDPSENSPDFRARRSHASDWMDSFSPSCAEENRARGDKNDVPEQEKSITRDSTKPGDSSKTKHKVKPLQTTDDNSKLKDKNSLDSESSCNKLAPARQDRTSVERTSKSVKESFSDKSKSQTVDRPPRTASMSSSETSALDAPRRKRKHADSETEMPLKRTKHSESAAVESPKVIDLKTHTQRNTSNSESEKEKKDKNKPSSPGDKENDTLNQKKSDKEPRREKSSGEKKISAMTDLERMKAYSAVAKRRELVQKIEAKDTRRARNRLLKEQAQNQANQKEASLIKNAEDCDQEVASAINKDSPVSLLSSEPLKQVDKMQEVLSEAKDSSNLGVVKDTQQLDNSQSKTITSSNLVSNGKAENSCENPELVSETSAQVSNASDIFKMLKKTTPSDPGTAAEAVSSTRSSSELALGGHATTASDVFKLLQQTSRSAEDSSSSFSRKPAQFPRSYRIPKTGSVPGGQPSPRIPQNESGMIGMASKVPPGGSRQHGSPVHGFGPKLKLLSLKPSSNTVKMAQKVTRTYNKQRDPRLPSSPRKGSSRRSPFPSPRKSGPAKKKEQLPASSNVVKLPTPEEIAKAIACDDDDDGSDNLTIDTDTQQARSTKEKRGDKPDRPIEGPASDKGSAEQTAEPVLPTKDKDWKRSSNSEPCSDSDMFLKPDLPSKQTPSSLVEKSVAKSEDSLMDYAIGSTPAYTSESFPLKEDIYEGSMDSSQFGFNFDDNEIEEHEELAFTGLVTSTSPKVKRKVDTVTCADKLPPTDDVVCSELDVSTEQMEVDVTITDANQESEAERFTGNTQAKEIAIDDSMADETSGIKTNSSASGDSSKSLEATDRPKSSQSNKTEKTTTEKSEIHTVTDHSLVDGSPEKQDFLQNKETAKPRYDETHDTTTSIQENACDENRQNPLVETSPIKTARGDLSVLDECSRDSLASSVSSDIDIETVDDPGIDVQVPFQVNADPVAEELSLHLESEESGSESESSFTASDSECSSPGSPVHVTGSPDKDIVVDETGTESQGQKGLSPVESERCDDKEEEEEEGICENDDENLCEANGNAGLDIQLHPGENYAQLGIDETTNDEAQLVNKTEKDSNDRTSDTEQPTRSGESRDSRSDKSSFDLREKLKQRRRSRDMPHETKDRRRTREESPSRSRSSRSSRDDRRELRDSRTRSQDRRHTPRSDRHRVRSPRPRSPVRRHCEKSRSRTPQRPSSRKPRSPRSEDRARRPGSSSSKSRLGDKAPRTDRSSRSGDERSRTKQTETSRRR